MAINNKRFIQKVINLEDINLNELKEEELNPSYTGIDSPTYHINHLAITAPAGVTFIIDKGTKDEVKITTGFTGRLEYFDVSIASIKIFDIDSHLLGKQLYSTNNNKIILDMMLDSYSYKEIINEESDINSDGYSIYMTDNFERSSVMECPPLPPDVVLYNDDTLDKPISTFIYGKQIYMKGE